jgi:triacylglycerol lipase
MSPAVEMYVPKGFEIGRAIELGELVDQAYSQFDAFLRGEPWKLVGGYELIQVLSFLRPSAKSSTKSGTYFELDLRGRRLSGKQTAKDIPIGYLAQRRDDVYLIFRGTMTAREWIRDFKMGLVPCSLSQYGRVHDGFQRMYSLIQAQIQESLAHVHQRSRLFIAGHSLGGALATLALPEIAAATPRRAICLYTYGSPRVGDNEFVAAFNRQFADRSFRIVNTSDIMASLPLPAPVMGIVGGYFSHVDTPVDFTIQADDLEENHIIKTYLLALKTWKRKKGLLAILGV